MADNMFVELLDIDLPPPPRVCKKSVKFGGGFIMAWVVFSSEGVEPLVRINSSFLQFEYLHIGRSYLCTIMPHVIQLNL